jgi:hypothetical protein
VSSALVVSVRKEARAVWLVWAACAVALVAVALIDDPQVTTPGRYLCVLGSVAIVALSIGHEYIYGTLPVLLSLPSHRRWLLLGKLVAVTPMLATLAALTLAFAPNPTRIQIATLLCAIAMAPWLTLACRSALAGTVFAIGLTGQIHFLADVASASRDALLWTLLGLCACSTAAGWRMFMRLEVGGGRARSWSGPAAFARPARDRHAFWLLVKKELRLHQVSFVVGVLYALVWVALSRWNHVPEARDIQRTVGGIYSVSLAVLIGSIPSAEERQLGTAEWQALLPLAAWKQWAIKLGIALCLALLLALGLPALLAPEALGIPAWIVGAVIFLTAGSLYVSSLCDGAVWAFTIAAPILFVVIWLLGLAVPEFGLLVILIGLAALSSWFAFANHRSAARDRWRVARQLLAMAAIALVGVLLAHIS